MSRCAYTEAIGIISPNSSVRRYFVRCYELMFNAFKFLQDGRLVQLLLLAVTVLGLSVISMSVADAIFVSHLGADQLPICFVFIGLCSMPAYASISSVMQRVRRTQMFMAALLVLLMLTLALRLALPLDSTPVYYGLMIVSFFQWDLSVNILFPSLLTDYFNTLEYKQYISYISIAQAVGILIGGSCLSGLSQWISPQDLLLCLPAAVAIALLQLIYLERTQRPLTSASGHHTVGILESLQSFPGLAKRYPLVSFLAASSFLWVTIYLSSEFLWFTIYSQQFNERELTAFIGLMQILTGVARITVLYLVTRPLLHWLGVARMNILFPLTTLASFISLGVNGNLSAAIGLQINGDGLHNAINRPVHQLNYNAIPQQFLERIRALSDGVIYAIGLICGGGFLWLCEHSLNLQQITWVSSGLVGMFLLVRLPMGRFYASGLEDLIRTDAIDLNRLASRQSVLPLKPVIKTLIHNDNGYDQLRGLELATRLGEPMEFLEDVLHLLSTADRSVRSAVVTLFSDGFLSDSSEETPWVENFVTVEGHTDLWSVWQEQLAPEQPLACRLTALEILIVQQQAIPQDRLEELSSHEDYNLRSLAMVALLQQKSIRDTAHFLQGDIDDGVAKVIMRVVARSGDTTLLGLLMKLLPQGTAETKQRGLTTLSQLLDTLPDEMLTQVIAFAQQNFDHNEPAIRIAALDLWQRCSDELAPLVTALSDSQSLVREAAATWLADKGGLAEAQAQLASKNHNAVNGAIATIGRIRTRQASDILYAHLAGDFRQLERTRSWQTQIPRYDPYWQPLVVAIADYHQRLLQKVLYILSSLGYGPTVNTVNQILATTDDRDRSNAVEVLASLNHRRFILPLLPLLGKKTDYVRKSFTHQLSLKWLKNKGYKILLEAIDSKDRWLRAGALIALAKIPQASLNDVDPIVRAVARDLFLITPRLQHTDTTLLNDPPDTLMNRLLILKDVALFQDLSLDELLLIDAVLEAQQFMAGETIFEEGSWGTHLYIIASGTVQFVKILDEEQWEFKQLAAGNHFGEIALFDDFPHWSGAVAKDDCLLLKLEKQRFINLTTQRPHILLMICRFISLQLREVDKFRSAKKVKEAASK